MSLTVILFIGGFAGLILGIGAGLIGSESKRDWIGWTIASLFIAVSVGSFIGAGVSLSDNKRESRQNCFDSGSVIWSTGNSSYCFKEFPVETQKL